MRVLPPLAQHAQLSSSAKADDPVNTKLSDYWMPAGACHRAAQSADPLAGMTAEIRAIPQKGIDIPALALSSIGRATRPFEVGDEKAIPCRGVRGRGVCG